MEAWPMVGRSDELGLISHKLATGVGGAGARGLILAGEPGVGKTRLARELFRLLRRRRLPALWVSASRTVQRQPLGAFAQLISAGSDSLSRLRELADQISPRGRHTSLFVDDVHALDPLSALLVQAVVSRPWVTALLTARAAEALPDAVIDLWNDGLVERVILSSLGEPDTEQLASSIVGRPVGPTAARQLWRRSRGNPLYITHIARSWRATGDGIVRFDGELPVELSALIQQVLVGLQPPELEVLDAISLLEPFPADAVSAVVPGIDEQLLERLELRGLVTVSEEGQTLWLRPGHPLFAESRRAAMGKLRARRLRTRILDALDAGEYRIDPVAIAELSVGSERGPDAQLCLRGAVAAFERVDLGLAAELAGAAVRSGGGTTAGVLQGYSLSMSSRGEDAAKALAPFIEGPSPSIDAVVLAGGNRYFVLRDPDGAVRDLARYVGESATVEMRAKAGPMYAWLCAFLARPEEALAAIETATGTGEVSPRGRAFIRVAALTAYAGLGRYDLLESVVEDGHLAIRGGADDAAMHAVLLDGHIFALGVAGRMDETAEVFERGLVRYQDAQPPFDAYLLDLLGRSLVARGRIEAGIAELGRAAAMLGDGKTTGWAVINRLAIAEALSLAGDPGGAEAALGLVRDTWHPGHVYRLPELGRVAAARLAASGQVAEAIATAASAAELAGRGDSPTQAIFALHAAIRYGANGLGARLRGLAAGIDSPRARLAPEHADAWDNGDATRLAELSTAFERTGDLVSAVDAEAQAASLWAKGGRASRAAESRLRIRRLQTITGQLHTPAVAQAELGGRLSRRESEIAMLIGSGHTDREIAAMLGLSPRTVEGHAHRVYEKLGLSGRSQLRGALGDRPGPEIE